MSCLNTRAFKVYLANLPDFMSYRVICLEKYIFKIKMETFICFDGNLVCVTLDKPEHAIPTLPD